MAARLGLPLVFKASFDKANRTSLTGTRGIGIEAALPVFADIRARLGLPVTTDVHTEAQCAEAGTVVDILQIPAFLCRQTDLLIAAARTGRAVNIKKGQFLAPWDMANAVAKVRGSGNPDVMVTERGTSFGYNTLVTDFRGLPILAETCRAPVIFDATHSVQQPGGQGGSSGGQREFVPVLARAAVSVRSRPCSSKPIPIRTRRRPTDRTWYRCARWRRCLAASRRSTGSPRIMARAPDPWANPHRRDASVLSLPAESASSHAEGELGARPAHP